MINLFDECPQNFTQSPVTDEPSREEKKAIRKHYNGIGIAMIFQTVLSFLVFKTLGYLFKSQGLLSNEFLSSALSLCTPALCSILIFFIYSAIKHTKKRELFSTENVTASLVLKAISIGFFLEIFSMILQFVTGSILEGIGVDNAISAAAVNADIKAALNPSTKIFRVFVTIVVGPIAEELFFRGIVLRGFSQVSQRFAIVISAIIFGLMHGNPYQAIAATLSGLVWGYITIKTGSLIPSIICHMVVNTIASLPELLSEKYSIILFSAFILIELVVGIIGFIIVMKKREVKLPPYTKYHKKRAMPIVITSAAVIIAFVLYICKIVMNFTPVA